MRLFLPIPRSADGPQRPPDEEWYRTDHALHVVPAARRRRRRAGSAAILRPRQAGTRAGGNTVPVCGTRFNPQRPPQPPLHRLRGHTRHTVRRHRTAAATPSSQTHSILIHRYRCTRGKPIVGGAVAAEVHRRRVEVGWPRHRLQHITRSNSTRKGTPYNGQRGLHTGRGHCGTTTGKSVLCHPTTHTITSAALAKAAGPRCAQAVARMGACAHTVYRMPGTR